MTCNNVGSNTNMLVSIRINMCVRVSTSLSAHAGMRIIIRLSVGVSAGGAGVSVGISVGAHRSRSASAANMRSARYAANTRTTYITHVQARKTSKLLPSDGIFTSRTSTAIV